jgi:glycerol-3-phosphate acyltransferase PlsY
VIRVIVRAILILAASYLIGGIPFGFIAAKMRGIDITRYGSGVTGATNVLRVLGPGPAIVVALLDVSKGVIAVLLAERLTVPPNAAIPVLSGLLAMTGHNFSPYLRFKGGKGVSVGAGVVLMIMPKVILVALAVFVVVVALTRYVSLASILGGITAAVTAFAMRQPAPHLVFVTLGALYVLVQHRSNIRRLLTGTESKIGQRVKIK